MIEVFTGTMFSGKSTKLIEIYNLIQDKSSVICFKPSKDKRDTTFIRARNVKEMVPAIVVNSFEDIEQYMDGSDGIKTIIIDEIQFLSGDYKILNKYSLEGIDIVIGGLSKTSELEPFGCMPNILAIADSIKILSTNCKCGNMAVYTGIKYFKKDQIKVGNNEYEPLCRECYVRKLNNRNEVIENIITRCEECKFAACEQCEINWKETQEIKKIYEE